MRLNFRDRWFSVVFRRDLAAWCIEVDDAAYLIGGTDIDREATTFLRERLRNVEWPASPSLVASRRFPFLVNIDGAVIRGRPGFVPRNRPGWSKTYENPATGIRVLAVEGRPFWLFESDGLPASPFGVVDLRDTPAAVRLLAAGWLSEREGRLSP